MSELELALKELESATKAVATRSEDDHAETRAAIDRAAWALRDLVALAAKLPAAGRERAIGRLLRGATR